jgi:hypothetical protein
MLAWYFAEQRKQCDNSSTAVINRQQGQNVIETPRIESFKHTGCSADIVTDDRAMRVAGAHAEDTPRATASTTAKKARIFSLWF